LFINLDANKDKLLDYADFAKLGAMMQMNIGKKLIDIIFDMFD